MRICSISDVHLTIKNKSEVDLFIKFLSHNIVNEADIILLLGDIFDVMIGSHGQYYADFYDVFEKMRELLSSGHGLYVFEGNHDFNLEKFYESIGFRKFDNFKILKGPEEIEFQNLRILAAHGDERDQGLAHSLFKKTLNSKIINFATNKLLSYKVINGVGEYLSAKSRNYIWSKEVEILTRQRFRKIAESYAKIYDYNFFLCGHSHIQDNYLFDENRIYLNNGFFPQSREFIVVDQDGYRFVKLD